jgi:hypothetical protein
MTGYKATCAPVGLTIKLDPDDVIPDSWTIRVVIQSGLGWLYVNKTNR